MSTDSVIGRSPRPDGEAATGREVESKGAGGDHRELLAQALEAVERMQDKLARSERAKTEPIAIIGAGCRFPGGIDSPDRFWKFLSEGRNAVARMPAERWSGAPEDAPFGGFLEHIDLFDADFFGISPREAESMDPQQRLVLEVAWEALEHAGITASRLRGSQTGIFIGATTTDYGKLAMSGDPAALDAYTATGSALNVIAGRVSYLLGLNGPAMAVDTACSSSVVAVHLACHSLRSGECDLALAGGVNALIAEESFTCFQRWGMMSPRGQCRAFDADADGFVRAEGCGVVTLKRLSDAQRDGDAIMAIIRSTAVNQDGASSGLTVPNGLAQQAVIRKALETARLDAARIGYVEAHGTGTNIGDPIEMEAIGAVLCRNVPRKDPLRVGSLKSNVGHMESAAGIGGLIKAALCLERGAVPRSLHFEQPNPRIDWKRYAVEVPTSLTPWPRGETPRLAAVSGFGFSGTNGHIVLEEAPAGVEQVATEAGKPQLLCLSAKSPAALNELAGRYAAWLEEAKDADPADVCSTAAARVAFPSRLALVAGSGAQFARALRSYGEGDSPESVVSGQAATGKRSVSFLFTGQGSQYTGMGAELYQQEAVFRDAVDECTDLLRPSLEHAIRDVMFESRHAQRLNQTAYTQPALFTLEWALAELWRSWGITPASVLGHSVGEYVAACVAGIMTVDEGARLLAKRAQLMQALPAGGGMTSVLSPESQVRSLLSASPELAIAAINSPESVVVSGPVAALERLETELSRKGTKFTRLEVSHAFHSPLMEPMLDAFSDAAHAIRYKAPACAFLSNLFGGPPGDKEIDGNYWVSHVREPVRFADCARHLSMTGDDLIVEIGPAPVLLGLARQCAPTSGARGLPSLRPGRPAREQMLESAGTAFVSGHFVRIDAVTPNRRSGMTPRLPTYPFQRKRHWLQQKRKVDSGDVVPPTSRLLGTELDIGTVDGRRRWQQLMSLERFPFVDDHRVQGMPIVPATAYIEMMLQAARFHLGDLPVRITNIDLRRGILLRPDERQKVQLEVEPAGGHRTRVRIFSRRFDDADGAWQLNVTADMEPVAEGSDRPSLDELTYLRERCELVGGSEFYRFQAEKGNQWGQLFQGVQALWSDAGEALAKVEVPEPLQGELGNYRFHPAVSDACGHVLVGTIPLAPSDGPLGGAFVGGGIGEARFYSSPTGSTLWCHARRRPSPEGHANVLCGDVTVFDETGALVSETVGARLWYLDDAERAGITGYDDWLYRIDWRAIAPSTARESDEQAQPEQWVVVTGRSPLGRAVVAKLEQCGEKVFRVESGAHSDSEGEATASSVLAKVPTAANGVIVDLRFLDLEQGDFAAATAGPLAGAQTLVRRIAAAEGKGGSRLWLVTAGAVCTADGDRNVCPAQALAWGFGRTAAVEHTEFWGGLVDLNPAESSESVDSLLNWIRRAGREDQVALRGGDALVPRLTRLPATPDMHTFNARSDASYLVTGGLGGLGLVVAERLAERGAGHLLLASRRRFPPRAEWDSWSGEDDRIPAQIAAIKRMEALGCHVTVTALDVSDTEEVERQLREWRDEYPPIRGVVHAAGIMQYEAIVEHSVPAMQNIVGSKAASAWTLHRLLSEVPLDFFVLYSSASSLLSSPFMSSYAAANTSLDALAALRRAQGMPALSINWGTWREAGMLLDFDDKRGDVELKGVGTLSNSEALGALEFLLRCDVAQAGVMKIDWPEWQQHYSAFAGAPYLSQLVTSEEEHAGNKSEIVDRLRAADPAERARLVQVFLVEQVERIFKIPAGTVDVSRPLADSGLDSLMAVELRNAIDTSIGVGLPMVRLVEGPSITELTEVIVRQIGSSAVRQSIASIRRDGVLPLSHAQRRLWFLDQLDPGSGAYVIPSALAIHGSIDVELVERSLTEIVRRHESLRTVFESRDGQPHVVVHEPAPFHVPLTDLEDLSEENQNERVATLIAANAQEAFDLSAGPLMRASIVRLRDTEHLLLLAFHHIVFDFWSAGVFVRELTSLYESYYEGRSSPLPDLSVQFLDFAHWQTERLDNGGREQHLAYWREQLDAELPFLTLPTDRPRHGGSARGSNCTLRIGEELTSALGTFSQRENVTLAMMLLAAFQVLLHRLSGQDRLQTGMPVAGRDHPQTTDMIGFFINTVVIRSDLDATMTFREFLQQVRRTALGAYEHQDMPFQELVAVLDPVRDMHRTPLFQAFFNHINLSVPAFELPGATVEPLLQLDLGSKFDLSFYAQEEGAGLNLMVVYDGAVFDAERMEIFLSQYRQLLEQVQQDPGRPASAYSIVTEHGGQTLPNPNARLSVSREHTSKVLTAWHISEFADRVAIRSSQITWTYSELDERANKITSMLVQGGIRRGDVVALHTHRDPLLVAAILGVLRAGGAFAILDHSYPDSRTAASFAAAKPRGLLHIGRVGPAGEEFERAINGAGLAVRMTLSEPELSSVDPSSDAGSHASVGPDDLAYVAFTSGTTGDIKAIAGTHRPVAHFLDWQKSRFDLRGEDRFSLLSGLSHDPLLRDVFAPLWSGGTLHVPDEEVVRDSMRLNTWMRTEAVSVVHLTPALASLLLAHEGSSQMDALRYAFFGGDVLHAETVNRLRGVSSGLCCVNFYGATETPQATSYFVLASGETETRERVPIGCGIDGVQLLIVNAAGALAGVGEVGEIVVRTPFLTKGYLGDGALTKARFTANPFTGNEDDLVYRTGDLGRYLPSGAVEIVGRSDNQVQVRGFRVELGSIEAALARHPAVLEAAVTLREDVSGQLVAYVVKSDSERSSGIPSPAELRAFLQRSLPEYMIPQLFTELETLPLTQNGKVDRRALPAPDRETTCVEIYVPPKSPTEQRIVEIWQELLGVERIGTRDDFFDRGGHSLVAAQVIARINSHFHSDLPLRILFEQPTPSELGKCIDGRLARLVDAEYLPIVRRDPTQAAPLSYAQERLWYLHQLAPDNSAYNLAGALELRGDLDIGALESALRAVVRRHEPLRTCITRIDGWPTQTVLDPSAFGLRSVDPSPSTSEEDLRRQIMHEVGRPFELGEGPLLRVTLFAISPTRHVLLFVCHHLVTDGWSMGVFARDLGRFYADCVRGSEVDLQELPIQYTDYAVWQRQYLAGQRLEGLLDYWRAQLDGAPPYLDLPTDHVRPPNFSYRGSRYSFRLSAALRDKLNALSRREGVTLFMTLLAAYQVLLSRYSNQSDVVVGTPVANRSRPELEGMIGFFVNTLVLRTELSGDLPFRELLEKVKDTCLDAYAHQQMPFERLVEALRPPRDLSRNPIFQVMFVLQNMGLPSVSLEGVDVVPYPVDRSGSQMDLSLYAWESEDGLQAVFEYSTDLFDAPTIERMARHLENLLQSAVDDPAAAIRELGVLDQEEATHLVEIGCGPKRQLDADDDFVAMFERVVDKSPDAIAVDFCSSQVTYSDLDASANRLSHYLQAIGIARGDVVGICLPRGLEMMTSVLAILKCGAAYLPLDPEYPTERLRYMLEDSGAKAIIATSSTADDLLSGRSLPTVCLDRDRHAVERQGSHRIAEAERESSDLAYMIYTSGSTGRPKGVEIEHRSLTNFLHSMAAEPGCGPGDTLVAVTTLSFDISILEILLPLTVGGRVVLVDRDTVTDGGTLASLLAQCNASIMQATPTTWRMLIDAGWEGSRDLKVLCGGEALPSKLAAQLLERVGELWNMYGPTETTIWSTCARITESSAIHVGGPIANTDVYILDDRMDLQPVGVAGHLFIGGAGVARGYHGRPKLTAEKFVLNPISGEGLVYGTGDRARWRKDGTIEHLGRADNQVKVRGHRIELGEIEACLSSHPNVNECAVVLKEARQGDQRLIAWYVPDKEAQITVTTLRSHLKERLPAFMIPQLFVELDSLPLTPNGKVDRNALPSPTGPATMSDSHVPPRTPAERYLAQRWQDIVGAERVGNSDNFFDIGGHSLLAARLVHEVAVQTGVHLTLQSLTSDTLAQIAANVPDSALPKAPSGESDATSAPTGTPSGTSFGLIRKLLGR